ncbi:MAG: SIMPL domain-containing protein [Ferruginibacter sp.]
MKKLSLLAVALTAFFVMPAHAQVPTQPGCYPFPKTIAVTGSAEMEIIPDEIYVQVDLREYKKKGEDKVELEKIKADFLANCKATGIPDSNISVASYDGYNMASIWNRRKKDPELLASISYQLKFRYTKTIDELVDKLDDLATNNFRIIRTSHSRMTEFRKQLKIQAVKAAKDKAQYLTEAVNEQLGQVITIKEPEEEISSDIQQGYYRSVTKGRIEANEGLRLKDNGYGLVDNGVDYRKIRMRYEVGVLFAIR